MDDNTCNERHKWLGEKVETHQKRLDNYSDRLDRIEQINSRLDERLSGLINQLSGLNTILKWFIGLIIGAFVSFFFYAIQNNIF